MTRMITYVNIKTHTPFPSFSAYLLYKKDDSLIQKETTLKRAGTLPPPFAYPIRTSSYKE